MTGGARVAVRLGGRPRCSRLQRQASRPVPAAGAGRRPAGAGSCHLAGGRVGQRKRQQKRWRRRARVAVSPGQLEPTAAAEPTGRGGGGRSRDREDQGGDAEEVFPEPTERPAAPRAPPSPDHPQRLLQGHWGDGERRGAPQQPSPNPTTIQPVWIELDRQEPVP